jgi:hypothetical protein
VQAKNEAELLRAQLETAEYGGKAASLEQKVRFFLQLPVHTVISTAQHFYGIWRMFFVVLVFWLATYSGQTS